jgi:hypothetical protein
MCESATPAKVTKQENTKYRIFAVFDLFQTFLKNLDFCKTRFMRIFKSSKTPKTDVYKLCTPPRVPASRATQIKPFLRYFAFTHDI